MTERLTAEQVRELCIHVAEVEKQWWTAEGQTVCQVIVDKIRALDLGTPGPQTAPGRKCFQCSTPISECMGLVKASDFVEAAENKRPWSQVRELCGKCGLMYIWNGDALVKRSAASSVPANPTPEPPAPARPYAEFPINKLRCAKCGSKNFNCDDPVAEAASLPEQRCPTCGSEYKELMRQPCFDRLNDLGANPDPWHIPAKEAAPTLTELLEKARHQAAEQIRCDK